MAYIAQQRMRVGDGYREYGEPIPEAAEWPWPIRDAYLRNNRIKEVPDAEVKSIKGRKADAEPTQRR